MVTKLLIIGANYTELEIIKKAKEMGLYTIVTDYQVNWDLAPAKKEADEAWNIDWTNIDLLAEKCLIEGVSGVFAGFSEVRIKAALDLSDRLSLPFYADSKSLDVLTSKIRFREYCVRNNIFVAKEYHASQGSINYPVIVKPSIRGGSLGITICYNEIELNGAVQLASTVSADQQFIIEEYLPYDEVMVYYLIVQGEVLFIAMCDRPTKEFSPSVPKIPIGYIYPSKYLDLYKEKFDEKMRKMIKDIGVKNGLLSFDALICKDAFFPLDPIYRLEGTMVYHFIAHQFGCDILKHLIELSISSEADVPVEYSKINPAFQGAWFELPIFLTKGTIARISGFDEILELPEVIHASVKSKIGDTLTEDCHFSQLFCRFLLVTNNFTEMQNLVDNIINTIKICDQAGNSMILPTFSNDVFAI